MASGESPRSGFFFRLKERQFRFSQQLLFSWIRPTILGHEPEHIGISPGDHVCYVMPFRSTADLLVLDRACHLHNLPLPLDPVLDLEDRSFFFLGHAEGRLGRKTLREQSARMQRLFAHQEQLPGNIKIVPVSLFWGHQPDKDKSLIKILLSENWTATSQFKKLMAGFFHRHHILAQFGEAIDLKALMTEEDDRERQIRRLHRKLRSHFTNQKQAIIGPDLSHRRTLINLILESLPVRSVIDEAVGQGEAVGKLEKRALAYANEIASDQSYRIIRLFYILLTWLWNKLYDGIDLNGIESAKTLARSFEVVYVPCHRSHIDYLLLSYVLYTNGLTPPHIAAGKNLNLPVIGPLLRRGGAFFMRRTFKGDELYKAVFDEYLHLMFTKGYSVEYFIEGGRSRTGRTLFPRTGMLGMTVQSYQRDASKPIVFLPVYFGYERILELGTYVGELAGKEKKQESIFDIFGIFRSLSAPFGRVAVNFGEPVILEDFLTELSPDWRNGLDKNQFSAICGQLARNLARKINDAVAVKNINLVATAVLATPRQTIRRDRLLKQIETLQQIAIRTPTGSGMTVSTEDPVEILDKANNIIQLEQIGQSMGDIYKAAPTLAILLTYYRNNSYHVFALSSFIARLVRTRGAITLLQITHHTGVLAPYLEAELFTNWQGDLAAACEATCHCLQALGLVLRDNDAFLPPEGNSSGYASLNDLGEIIEPTLERFYIVSALLGLNQHRTTASLESAAAEIAEQLSTIYGINSPEFFDSSLFKVFIDTLHVEHCIDEHTNVIEASEKFTQLTRTLELLLDSDVKYNVLQAITSQPS